MAVVSFTQHPGDVLDALRRSERDADHAASIENIRRGRRDLWQNEKHTTVPTIGQLMRGNGKWIWVYCSGLLQKHCGHRKAVALAPFAIRWGVDASSDMIRRNLKCSRCGTKGVMTMMPSRGGLGEVDAFPSPPPPRP